jgi:hypothetical protein
VKSLSSDPFGTDRDRNEVEEWHYGVYAKTYVRHQACEEHGDGVEQCGNDCRCSANQERSPADLLKKQTRP